VADRKDPSRTHSKQDAAATATPAPDRNGDAGELPPDGNPPTTVKDAALLKEALERLGAAEAPSDMPKATAVPNGGVEHAEGRPLNGNPPARDRDGELLKEAVANPGAAEIPDDTLEVTPGPAVEIPEATLDPDGAICGERLDRDPAVMTVELGRPGPQSWVALFPDRVLRTVMLAHKPQRDGSPVYLWVAPHLQRDLKRHLKQVQVFLVFDTGGEGDCFLWVVPESSFSPYYSAASSVLARGNDFVRAKLFCFPYDQARKKVDTQVRNSADDDPPVVLPSRSVGKLLWEALKPERRIENTDHPVYQALTAGRRLT
jgi:hypothetical protein